MIHDPQRWLEVKRLFFEALDQPSDVRIQFLKAKDGVDPDLLELAVDMLSQHEREVEGFEDDPAQPRFPSRIGPYKVSHLVAASLTTLVLRADRDDGQFEQAVAIKLIHPSAISRETLLRMEAERRILASLNHPAICRLLDAGQLPTGQHYLVLEWIDGVPFLEHAAGMDLRARLALFREICLVIEAAHRLLVVHRDLKPAHVLVTPEGNLKVLDFGIAKLLPDPNATQHAQTQLTPAYASPEQWRGEPATPAFDVFSLGVMLHELLAGRHPLGEPPAQPYDWNKLDIRLADRGLTSIAVKATHPQAALRYSSVESFRHDIENYLEDKPISARRSNWLGDATLWCKRNRTILIPVGLCLLFGAYELTQLWNRRELERERGRQAQAAARSIVSQTFAVASSTNLDPAARRQILYTAMQQLQLSESFDNSPADLKEISHLYGQIGAALGESFAEHLEDFQTAEKCARRAVAILEGLAEATELERVNVLMLLSDILFSAGHSEKARLGYENCLNAMRRLPNQESDFVRSYQTVAQSMIGDILLLQGRPQEALVLQKAVLEVRLSVHRRSGGMVEGQPTAHPLGNVHYSLARTHDALRQSAEALHHARESVVYQEQTMSTARPYPRELAESLLLLADLERQAGLPSSAHSRRAEALVSALLQRNPGSLPLKRLLAQAGEGNRQ